MQNIQSFIKKNSCLLHKVQDSIYLQ